MSDTFTKNKNCDFEVECSCGQKVIMREGFGNAVHCRNCGASMALVKDEKNHPDHCIQCNMLLDRPRHYGVLCSYCERDLERSSRLTATKHDAAKPRHSLLPPHALDAIIAVLEYGAVKYGARNWTGGMAYSRPWDAAKRHMWAWWKGEDVDPESGLPHLAHAIVSLMFLIDYQATNTEGDDRNGPTGK